MQHLNIKFPRVALLLLLLSFVWASSCRTTGKVVTPKESESKDFYKKYSKVLGIELKGTENKELIRVVSSWLGTPYKYGGVSKDGTDCSGFVKTVYESLYKISLYRSAADLEKNTDTISKKDLKTGDLVFFKFGGTKISHVGIYLADNKFIHASSSKGVIVSDLTIDYYKKGFYCAGRIKDLK